MKNERRMAPLIDSEQERLFWRTYQEIKSIAKVNSLHTKAGEDFSPEHFWQEFIEAIQFIPFDSFLALTDKIIDDHESRGEIHCVYYDHGIREYSESPIPKNSNEFMIQLLKARIQQLEKNIKVFVHNSREDNSFSENVIMVDDVLYSGSQMDKALSSIPPLKNRTVRVYTVAATAGGEKTIKNGLKKHSLESDFTAIQQLKLIKEQLSKESFSILCSLLADDYGFPFHYAHSEASSKCIAFTPFKVPDAFSILRIFIPEILPVHEDTAYIPPKNLLEPTR